jgi:hypothetical protein
MNKAKSARPGITPIAWALMRKWAWHYDVPVGTLNRRFEWAVKLAKAYSEAPSVVVERQVGLFL